MSQPETTRPEYFILMVHIHNPLLDGINENSSHGIDTHFIIDNEVELHEFYTTNISDMIHMLREAYTMYVNNYPLHPTMTYFHEAMDRIENVQYDIGYMIELPGLEQVAILKTCWIRIFQRKWRNYLRKKKELIQRRKDPRLLFKRQLYGRW